MVLYSMVWYGKIHYIPSQARIYADVFGSASSKVSISDSNYASRTISDVVPKTK